MMIVIGGFAGFLLERYKYRYFGWEAYLLMVIPIFLLLLFYVRGRQIFEYDSDGEALNFKNRNVVPFIQKHLSDEFPKYKLMQYELVNAIFFRRLYIKLYSKKKHTITLKYDVSYFTKREICDLKISLNKVIKRNKEYPHYSED